ncbi:hypothetical protein OESDEN_17855 [Oesophagostomum dentatum]|uniref:Uncharacterized protein n=1 Tax=Oesophagostomum dentatum TaxID=61180 RepID=A0A0B1SEY2_OESDE|nr:hypothetical protein OESDEN_17855 [Oesophagostomum dentatum]
MLPTANCRHCSIIRVQSEEKRSKSKEGEMMIVKCETCKKKEREEKEERERIKALLFRGRPIPLFRIKEKHITRYS